jgi:hypothetical protein
VLSFKKVKTSMIDAVIPYIKNKKNDNIVKNQTEHESLVLLVHNPNSDRIIPTIPEIKIYKI